MSETGIQKITPCRLCQRNYTTRGISRHLRSCIPQNAQGSGETLHLTVQAGLYQMELALQPTCTFGELDRFLRKIWLECCKHISKFVIDGENFRKMKTPIAERSSPGAWFEHVYDAGSSTTLRIKENPRQPGLFAAILDGCTMPRTPGIRIIARNLMPELCACGGAAEFITDADWDQVYDQVCDDDPEWESDCFCPKCCPPDRDDLRDLVNSPRDGYECFDDELIHEEVRLDASGKAIHRPQGADNQAGMTTVPPAPAPPGKRQPDRRQQ